MSIVCPETKKECMRACSLESGCFMHQFKTSEKGMELVANCNYFIPEHRLGAIGPVCKAMLNNRNKRSRRVELNHIQHVLKTLKLIPAETKVISLGLGCLDTGELGLFVLCSSPHQIFPEIPSTPGDYAAERKR